MKMEWKGDKVMSAADKAVTKGLLEVGIVLHGQAVELCPVKTGNLKNSISFTLDGKVHGLNSAGGQKAKQSEGVKSSRDKDAVTVGTNVEYAARLEFGFQGTDSKGRKYNQPAQPYLRPAVDVNIKNIEKILGGEVGKGIKIEGAGK